MRSEGPNTSEDIKRLLILLLVKLGASSQEIGSALGVGSSAVRKMIPARNVKKINFAART